MPSPRILAAILALFIASNSFAGEVRVNGVHLCCGSCVAGVDDALEEVEGVSEVAADRNAKVVTFQATDDKAARAGIDALAKAGFHGTAKHGDAALAFPDSGAKPGSLVQKVELRGVHLCCAACVTGTQEALQEVPGLEKLEIDRKERVVRLFGKGIDEAKAVAALNAGGFHGTVHRGDAE